MKYLAICCIKKGAKVTTGIDYSVEAIEFSAKRFKNMKEINFVVGSAYEIPFKDSSFDSIVSTEVIEHLAQPKKMLKEIKRLYNGKGKIIITTPIRFTEKPLDKMHVQKFFEMEFLSLLNEVFNGYRIQIVKSYPLFWLELQNKSIFGKSIPKILLNLTDLFLGFNPHKSSKGWRYYTLQQAIITRQ